MKYICYVLFFSATFFMKAQQSYLALGDSYTIGELVKEKYTWPQQLVDRLKKDGVEISLSQIIAVTGWRTDELIQAINQAELETNSYAVVSLLIGVNNQYQGKAFSKYEVEFKQLLEKAIALCKHDEAGVFVVGIPDYSTTQFAIEAGKPNIKSDLKAYNAYAQQLCKSHGIPFYDILNLASKLNPQEGMLASDNLHPSELQYTQWINSFYNQVLPYLKRLPNAE